MNGTYQSWAGMKYRCLNPRSQQFKNYGGRGIKICKRWLKSFAAFLSDMGGRPDGLTLERIDNNGNYTPKNCRWATRAEQRINQRSCHYVIVKGEKLTLRHAAHKYDKSEATVLRRIRNGMTVMTALTTPINKMRSYVGMLGNKSRWSAIAKESGNE